MVTPRLILLAAAAAVAQPNDDASARIKNILSRVGSTGAAPDGAARWAIGVYNFDKVKAEACEIAVLASLDAGRAQVRRLTLTRTPP